MSSAALVQQYFARVGQSSLSPKGSQPPLPFARPHGRPRLVSASNTGTLQNWFPRRQTTIAEARDREQTVLRAMDLDANDPHVAGLIETMNINTVGIGYTPQAQLRADQLPGNLSDEQISSLQRRQEWEFGLWSREADITGMRHLQDIFALADRTMLVRGEYLILVRMLDSPQRRYSTCLQVLDPLRLRTPTDLMGRADIIDGVQVDENGRPILYWIQKAGAPALAGSEHFAAIPVWHGHRRQILHGYVHKDPDQYRGYTFFAPAMKFFRDLSDHLDAELVSNIVTSAAALWIATPNPTAEMLAAAGTWDNFQKNTEATRYEAIHPGGIFYGNPGEEPKVLQHNRPGANFVPFVHTILDAASTVAAIPREVATHKYGDMSYATARAAMMDAWRVFNYRQTLECRHLAEPCWEMLQEEAYLRGHLGMDMPDFYLHRQAWCRCRWIPQRKGFLDLLKEMQGQVLGLKYNILNHADIDGEQGHDWEEHAEQTAQIRRKHEALGLVVNEKATNVVSKENGK